MYYLLNRRYYIRTITCSNITQKLSDFEDSHSCITIASNVNLNKEFKSIDFIIDFIITAADKLNRCVTFIDIG